MHEFFPNTDNFFKYLLTIGLLLIIFTIIYPVQKQKEVDLELLSYNKDSLILNHQITNLTDKVSELKSLQKIAQHELDSLKYLMTTLPSHRSELIQYKRIQTKKEFDSLKKTVLVMVDSMELKKLSLSNTSEKIQKLASYYSFFQSYKWIFIILGGLLSIFGIRYWLASVYMEEVEKSKKISPIYRSSFIRHCDACKTFYSKYSLLLLTVALFIILCYISCLLF